MKFLILFTIKQMTKITLEIVQKLFKDNNCELISQKYINNRTPLEYKCECGNISTIRLYNFKNGRRCKNCGLIKLKNSKKNNYDDVKNYFIEHNCILLSSEYISCHDLLDYICECKNEAKISFSNFKNGHRCNKCGIQKRKFTNLELYGNEVALHSNNIKNIWTEKVKNKTESEKKEIQNKSKETCLKKYDKEFTFNVNEFKEKSKETNLKRYGFEHPMQNIDIQNKQKETNLEKYGFEYPIQNNIILQKSKKTCLERYGFENPMQNIDIQNKSKKTCLEKYGVEYVLQSTVVKDKSKEACLERYGVEYAIQYPEICEKNSTPRNKKYILPSGKEVNIQGYENFALDILLQEFTEDEILNSRTDMPVITYKQKNINRRYFPDIYIPKINKIIEVKSTWTYKKFLIKNILKAIYTRKLGYDYEVWIFDKNQLVYVI